MKPITMCVVGLNFGAHMIENELYLGKHPLVKVTAVCDFNREKADKWAKKIGGKAYYSLDTALADDEIDSIGLFSGPVGRAKIIDTIISAGKDVMTTKPFELSSQAAKQVLAKAKALGRTVHLNSPSPTLREDLRQVVAWKEEYDMGRTIAMRGTVWCNYREKADGTWYDNPKLCPVAPVFRLGVYLLNDLIPIMGAAEKVIPMESRIFTGRPTADNAQLSIVFSNGSMGHIFASFCVDDGQFYRNSFEINFERGTIYRNIGAYMCKESTQAQLEMSAVFGGEQIVKHHAVDIGTSGYQWEVFYRAVQGEPLSHCVTDEEIVNTTKIIEKMMKNSFPTA